MVGRLKKLWRFLLQPKAGYPENCIKGIARDDGVTDGGQVSGHVFYFKPEHLRKDGWFEESINWEDDSKAQDFTLKQRKNGNIQWQRGIAILPRKAIDRINELPTIKGLRSYERDTLKHNIYHGNLLLKEKVEKAAMRAIAGNLATNVTKVISQKYK